MFALVMNHFEQDLKQTVEPFEFNTCSFSYSLGEITRTAMLIGERKVWIEWSSCA